jgi:RimJ/RimL family protein N-acetyltransferase
VAVSKTNELLLRDIGETDIPVFFDQQRDPQYARMAAFFRRDPSDRVAVFAHWEKILRDVTVVMKAIVLDGSVVGSVGSWVLHGERQVTYGIAREYWGKGLATRALLAFLREFPERPLHASVAFDNLGSLQVLRKCGFKPCGSAALAFAGARGEEIAELFFRLD